MVCSRTPSSASRSAAPSIPTAASDNRDMGISATARSVSLRPMSAEDAPDRHVIDIFMMSIKCGNCDTYQTIVKFRKGPEKNVYTYECENEICDPNVTRTIVEVPRHLDNSTRRAEELPYYAREEPPPEEPAD